MTERFRTGGSWGVTLIETGSGEPDAQGRREGDRLVAVVMGGAVVTPDRELAERVAWLLDRFGIGNPRGYHPTCIETTGYAEIAAGTRTFICGRDCPPPPPARSEPELIPTEVIHLRTQDAATTECCGIQVRDLGVGHFVAADQREVTCPRHGAVI